MKKKNLLIVLVALTLVIAMSVTAFAATTPTEIVDSITQGAAGITQGAFGNKFFGDRPERGNLTDEQKAEMDARREQMIAMNEKWNNLSESQKNEIYNLKDAQSKIDEQILDKYVSWGLMDKDTAADIRTQITERNTQMRENGMMPMAGGKGGFGRHGDR